MLRLMIAAACVLTPAAASARPSVVLTESGYSAFVNYSDLNLGSPAGQAALKHRIQPPADFVPTTVSGEGAKTSLQDQFLGAATRDKERMTLFLVNGVMLQGTVVGFDQFSLVLERGGQIQLVYKHAISTLQPGHALNLGGEGAGDSEEEQDS